MVRATRLRIVDAQDCVEYDTIPYRNILLSACLLLHARVGGSSSMEALSDPYCPWKRGTFAVSVLAVVA